jgi:hypothetical protein
MLSEKGFNLAGIREIALGGMLNYFTIFAIVNRGLVHQIGLPQHVAVAFEEWINKKTSFRDKITPQEFQEAIKVINSALTQPPKI